MVLGCLCVDFWLWSFASERKLDMKQIFRVIMCVALFAGLPVFADFQKGWDALKRSDYETALHEWSPFGYDWYEADYDKGSTAYWNGDYATALREFRPLAEQGDRVVQMALSSMYYNGWGVPQDYVLAHMWANLSASQGIEAAVSAREIAEEEMTTEQIAEAQKLARECVAKDYKGC